MATEMLKARIYENIIGYKGKIDIWDVVNEPVNTVPWEVALKDTLNRDFVENRKNIPEEARDYWVKSINNPSLTVFLPAEGKSNGCAVIVAPGG
jgi:hypothetical protein